MVQPLGIDTSLEKTGIEGIDSPTLGMDFSMPTVEIPQGYEPGNTTYTPQGGGSGSRGNVVSEAKKYLGVMYQWGGTSPKGFDCSGLVQYVLGRYGVNVPRVSYQQARAGQRVDLGQLQPGDLVAWDNATRNPGADHIAIYIGNGQIIEAPSPGKAIRIRTLGADEGAWGVQLKYPGE